MAAIIKKLKKTFRGKKRAPSPKKQPYQELLLEVPPPTGFDDNIYLTIFANFDRLTDLAAVAQSSERLRKLAYRTFNLHMNGTYCVDYATRHSLKQSRFAISAFAPAVRHFDFAELPLLLAASPTIWQQLDLTALETMQIETFCMLTYIAGQKLNKYGVCEQLERLELLCGRMQLFELKIDFPAWFPKLKALTVEHAQALSWHSETPPRTLETLIISKPSECDFHRRLEWLLRANCHTLTELQYDIRHDGLLDRMIELGLHKRLERFRGQINLDQEGIEAKLAQFRQLRELKVRFHGRGMLTNVLQGLPQLTALECLHINFDEFNDGHQSTMEQFLMALPEIVSPQLREFQIDFSHGYQVDERFWTRFVAEMPGNCYKI